MLSKFINVWDFHGIWKLTVLYLTFTLVKNLGFSSVPNSFFDSLGFVAPILINGNILIREITTSVGWDITVAGWHAWIQSLQLMKEVRFPRMNFPVSICPLHKLELHTFDPSDFYNFYKQLCL